MCIFITCVNAELIRKSRNIGWRSGKFEALGWRLQLLEKLLLTLQGREWGPYDIVCEDCFNQRPKALRGRETGIWDLNVQLPRDWDCNQKATFTMPGAINIKHREVIFCEYKNESIWGGILFFTCLPAPSIRGLTSEEFSKIIYKVYFTQFGA